MAAKKISKSDFIRQRPELDTDQLVAEAAKVGLALQRDTVHKIRSIDRIKAGQPKRKGGKPKGKLPKTVKGSGKEFILSQPREMPVKDVIEEAKKRGLKPPHAVYVSSVRTANDRKNGQPKKRGRKPGKAIVTPQLRVEQGGRVADPIEMKLLEDAVAIAVKIGLRRMTQHFAQFASNI